MGNPIFLRRTVQNRPISIIFMTTCQEIADCSENPKKISILNTLFDCFRVQLETERWTLPQIIIFLAKLIWRMGDLVKPTRKAIE